MVFFLSGIVMNYEPFFWVKYWLIAGAITADASGEFRPNMWRWVSMDWSNPKWKFTQQTGWCAHQRCKGFHSYKRLDGLPKKKGNCMVASWFLWRGLSCPEHFTDFPWLFLVVAGSTLQQNVLWCTMCGTTTKLFPDIQVVKSNDTLRMFQFGSCRRRHVDKRHWRGVSFCNMSNMFGVGVGLGECCGGWGVGGA